jgi:TPR repeat protein
VLFSEVLADRDVTTHNPSYIVGNSYFHGRGVEQNYEKALKYWTRPILHDVQEVQESVANIYGDSDGDFYDPEKESEYRARVKN